MTRTAESVRALMRAADPMPPDRAAECDSMLDSDLAELLARVQADPGVQDVDVWDLIVDPPRGRSRLALPAIAAAAVLAAAVAIVVAVTVGPGNHRAPAGDLSSAAGPTLTRGPSADVAAASRAAAAAESAAAEKLRARTALEAHIAARSCAREVNTTLRGMVGAYQHSNGGKAAALRWLESVHAPSTRLYTRDAAAFGDWLTRGGPTGKIDIASAVARACIQ